VTKIVLTDGLAGQMRIHVPAAGDMVINQPLSRIVAWFACGAVIGTTLIGLGYVGFGFIWGTILAVPFMLVSAFTAIPFALAMDRVFDHNQTWRYWRSVVRAELRGPRPPTPLQLMRAVDLRILRATQPTED